MFNSPPNMIMNHQTRFRPQAQYPRQSNYVPRGRGPRYGQQFNNWKQHVPGQNYQDEHWCETCDRGFATVEMLENHRQQHQKCNIDGCQFIAHPKVITKHIQMQHSSGLFNKIANLKNPDDIKKWREERKKKYPTKENVERKNAELKEKIERGEKMGLRFRDNRNKKSQGEAQKRKYPFGNNFENKKKNHEVTKDANPESKKNPPKKYNNLPPANDIRKLKPFAGILYMVMDSATEDDNKQSVEPSSYMIDDDEDNYVQPGLDTNASQIDKPFVCGALSTLMCDYGTSDEEEKETLVGNHTAKNMFVENNKIKLKENYISPKHHLQRNCFNLETVTKEDIKPDSDGDSGPEEIKVTKPIKIQTDVLKQLQSAKDMRGKREERSRNNFHKRKLNVKPKSRLPSTLLQKLLYREIKQERNVVLQCIRHIVKHNYFEK